MTDFVISDQHFGHKNVIEYCKRPFSDVGEMEHAMIDNWNSVVQFDDTVYILGDFAFCGKRKAQEILSYLRGKKVFVWGNHDRGRENAYLEVMGVTGTDFLKLKHEGKSIVMTHYPFESFREDYHFHGHTHGHSQKKAGRVDIGVDSVYPIVTDLFGAPITLKDAMDYSDHYDSLLNLERGRY